MRVKFEQLAVQLQQDSLSPIYLIFGEEQLLLEEASDLVRKKAREQGVSDRQVWHVDARFNWAELSWQEQEMSLFSSQRLIELRIPTGKPGKEGGEALRAYAADPPADTTLLIICGKVDNRSQKAKWFTELDRIGTMVPVWSVDLVKLPGWISQRMKQRGLRSSQKVVDLLAERVEGNLFAAAQEVEKLALICPDGKVSEQQLIDTIADNTRFKAFGLVDAVLAGQTEKLPRILARLRAEGQEVMAVFSAVSWSLHRIIDVAIKIDQGLDSERAFSQLKPPVWSNQKPMIKKALARHNRQQWQGFLRQLSQIDQAAKGVLSICPWALLETLCMQVAGCTCLKNEENRVGR